MKSLVPAEFLRFFGTRLWLLHLAAALACGLGLVGLVAVVGPENSDPPLPPLGSPEGAGVLLQFVQMTLFVPAALGTFAITSEFRHRTIGSTFLAEPRRGRVMAAKLTVHGVIGLAYGVILAAGAGAALWIGSLLHGTTVGLAAGDLVSTLTRIAVAAAVHMLLGVTIGALVRHQIAGLVVVAGYFYLLEPMLMLLPGVNQIYGVLPGGAAAALTRSSWLSEMVAQQLGGTSALLLPAWAGAAVLAGYALVAAIAAVWWPLRRDLV